VIRPAIRARFRALVVRAIAKADRETAETLASIRPYRKGAFRHVTGRRRR